MMRQLSALAEANLVITARQGPTSGHYLNPLPQSTTLEQAIGRCIGKFAVRFSSALMALDDQVIADHGTETPRRADRHEPSLRMVETAALARNSRGMFAYCIGPGFPWFPQ
jgi:hypothetical protein